MATRAAALPSATTETSFRRYLVQIQKFPVLTAEQEYLLAKRWRQHGDSHAAQQLVTSHLRLSAKLAMGFRGYGLPISELISEGNVGLMRAVKLFEPDRGFRLATYAAWWIRAAIQQYILRSWSLVKLGTTASQRKLFFKLRAAKRRIAALEPNLRPDQVMAIAQSMGVPEQDVVDMNQRLDGDVSLNAPVRDDGNSGEWQDWLVDDSRSQEAALAETEETDIRHTALREALRVLDDRERSIFVGRRLSEEPITLEAFADRFGVSSERVRQIEIRAFQKVQKAVKRRVAHEDEPLDRIPIAREGDERRAALH